jgi:membrane protein required for colicin V production
MNLFDVVVVIILCFCLIRGGFRGLIKEISGIVGVIAGFYVAYIYYPQIAHRMSGWISNEGYCNILAFMIIFCVLFVAISVLGIIIRYILNKVSSGWADRIWGVLLGFAKGCLIVAVLFIALTAFLPKGTPFLQQSRLSPYVAKYAEVMVELISKDMKDDFKDKYKELKVGWSSKQ